MGMPFRRRSTAAVLAALLFLQAAIAVVACERPARAAAMALAMTQRAAHADHHGAQGNPDLCLARCGSQDQTRGKAHFNLPDLALHPGLVIRLALEEASQPREDSPTLLTAIEPPPRILFQSFLL
jgi:hypothetical protein